MIKDAYFDDYWGEGWPSLEKLEPYFIAPPGKEWFYTGGNDTATLSLIGIDGTEHLPPERQREITLYMTGNPDHGVHFQYARSRQQSYCSKGDLTRLHEHVYSLHDDGMPIGLFVPFPTAWLVVKEFIETEGQLPKCIEWVSFDDLPAGAFPDPFAPRPPDET